MDTANHGWIGSQLTLSAKESIVGWEPADGPRYGRVADALAEIIERGDLLPGMRLPPEREFAARLGLGRSTIAACYRLLEERGLVSRRQGRGTEVVARDGRPVDGRAAELAGSLQRNLLFRHLGHDAAGVIDLLGSCAAPSPRIREAIAAASESVHIRELLSSHGYFPNGYPPLREAVAAHLCALGLPTVEDEVLITGGAQQAINLVVATYVDAGSDVLVEDPTFPGALDALRMARARVLTVPVGGAGADVELMRSTLAESQIRLAYLMPTFHNPTGAVMPEGARREVASLSRVSGVPVIEDNTLAELALGAEPPRPLAAFSPDGPVLTIGSLSKLFWAGLRVGWVRAPTRILAHLERLKVVADLGTSLTSQAIAIQLLSQVEEIRSIRRAELLSRRSVLEDLLARHLPDWTWSRPSGGLTLWARLPIGHASELAHVASRHGVWIVPGSVMSASGALDEFVRLPFDHGEEILEEGITRLGAAWTEYKAGEPGAGAVGLVV